MTKSQSMEVVRAFDGSTIREVPTSDFGDVEAMLRSAEMLHRDPSGPLPAWQRIEILRALIPLMEEQAEAFALLIASEGGKPLVDARVETRRAIEGIHIALAELYRHAGSEVPMGLSEESAGRLAFTTKEPIGVVVAVSAFNHPLNLIVHQVVPAVAVGCPVIVKPASFTPLSCLKFVDLLREAGLPEEWCQVCICANDVAEKLVTDSRVSFFSFIGSFKVGWSLRSKLAPGTRCALEHGGAAPVIVCDDAEFDTMVPLLVKGGYYHAGQVCVSVQRVFVHNSIKADLVEALVGMAGSLRVGDPQVAETEVGPLIRPGEADRVEEWVVEAVTSGAKCAVGGKRIDECSFAPTVLVDPSPEARVSTSEVFGPVIGVYGFDDMDEAISRANSLPVAFQAAVFTKDIRRAFHAVRRLDASAVMVNDHTAFRVDWMPFAGRRTSGLGTGGIGHTMAEMSQEKMAVVKIE